MRRLVDGSRAGQAAARINAANADAPQAAKPGSERSADRQLDGNVGSHLTRPCPEKFTGVGLFRRLLSAVLL
jgi:hypothetical protein